MLQELFFRQSTTNATSLHSSLLRLNDQIRPITELLKIAEKVNLAPDVLEPEPSSIKEVRIHVHVPKSQS